MSLRTKILAGFGAILALVIIVWIWAIVHLYQLGNASDAILEENYRSILASEQMIGSLERQNSAALMLLLNYEEDGLVQFRRNEVEFLQWLGRAQDNVTIAGEAEVLQSIQDEYAAYLVLFAQLSTMYLLQPTEATGFYHQAVLPQFQLVRSRGIELRNLNEATMLATSARTEGVARWAIGSTIAVGAVIALFGLILSLWFSRLLVQPLQAMSVAAEQIAEGNYTVSLATHSSDELGRLAQKIMVMSHKLNTFHRLNVGQLLAEKRRSEAVMRSITDGIVLVNGSFEIIGINPQAAEIFGVKAEKALGVHFFDVVQDPKLYEHVKVAANAGREPELSEDESQLVVERENALHYYHFVITPVKSEHHELLGIILLLQDVTKLKQLDQLKSDFIMTASHELRTPLTSMSMSLGLLSESIAGKLTEREQEHLILAGEEVHRLRALVNDLLDLSKIESGHMVMDFEAVQPAWLVEKAVALFVDQAAQKEVVLEAAAPTSIPAIWADPTKVIWILTNLISNALRYTNAGGCIRIAADLRGSFIHFSVADTGSGIPLEYQSRIFDKFVQVEDERAVDGTGLGLAICKEIVKAHGGTIWVDSQVGKGSTFTFSMPLAERARA
jgi:two-component system, NtrC family, sensor histidine kinase KinB